MHYIDSTGNYYIGDQADPAHLEVTERPDPKAVWQDGWVIPPPSLLDYDIAIERHLDAEAEAAGYYDPLNRIPNIDRACSYAAFPNPYMEESQTFVSWRAKVWAHVFQVKLDVDNGTRPQPTIEELIAELPAR